MVASVIRPARPEDVLLLGEVERVACQRFAGYPYAQVMTEVVTPVADLRAAQQDGTLFVAEADAGVVGFALARPLGDGLHLDELDVLESHGRRGLGARLVAAVLDCARQRGLPYVTLSTMRSVPWNAPWYERLGFRVMGDAELTSALGEQLVYERGRGLPMEDRVLMKREVSG